MKQTALNGLLNRLKTITELQGQDFKNVLMKDCKWRKSK